MKPNQAFFPLSVSLSSFHTKRSAGKKKKKKSATRRARFFQAGMRRISAAASSPPRPSIRRAVRTSLAPAHCTPCSTGRRKEKVDVCVGGCVGGGWWWWWVCMCGWVSWPLHGHMGNTVHIFTVFSTVSAQHSERREEDAPVSVSVSGAVPGAKTGSLHTYIHQPFSFVFQGKAVWKMTSSLANQANELNEDILLMKAEENDIECITFGHQILSPCDWKKGINIGWCLLGFTLSVCWSTSRPCQCCPLKKTNIYKNRKLINTKILSSPFRSVHPSVSACYLWDLPRAKLFLKHYAAPGWCDIEI